MSIAKLFKSSKHMFFAGTLLLLFLSFSFNIFGVGVNESWFADFEQGSENIIKNTAQCKDDQDFYSGPLIYKNYQGGTYDRSGICNEKYLTPYSSQFGLQARTLALFAPDSDAKINRYFKYAELSLALVTAILFTLFAMKVRRHHGGVVASFLAVMVAMSPWVIGYAGNTYWVLPLFIAPFILTYCLYDKLVARWQYLTFYILITLLFTLKLLNGYEHITTMVMSVLAVVVFYEFQSFKTLVNKLVYPVLFIGASAVIAFSAAVTLNIVGLNEYYRETGKSIEAISQRAEARSGTISSIINVQPHVVYALRATLPDVYNAINHYHDLQRMNDGKSNPVLYFALSAVNYALLPAVNVPVDIKGIFGVFIQSVLFVGMLGYFAVKRINNKDGERLFAAACTGLIGALSWLVLMPAHAYPHAFLNGIIFYVPFLMFVFIILGVWLREALGNKATYRVGK